MGFKLGIFRINPINRSNLAPFYFDNIFRDLFASVIDKVDFQDSCNLQNLVILPSIRSMTIKRKPADLFLEKTHLNVHNGQI